MREEVSKIRTIGECYLQASRLLFDEEGPAIEAAATAVSEHAYTRLTAMAHDVLARDPHSLADCIRLAALAPYLADVFDAPAENMGERVLQALVRSVAALAETEGERWEK